jgi:hypothetical protein
MKSQDQSPGDEGQEKSFDETAIDAMAITLVALRKEAIEGRVQSGIETQWTEDEEFYQGYDDANRHEHVKVQLKPGEQERKKPLTSNGSTVFPNITAPYVDAAAARVGDMLMPTDDRNFATETTPIPDLMESDEAQMQPTPAGMDSLSAQVSKANSVLATAKQRAARVQEQIDDYLTECQYHAELRKAIDDAARIGSAVIKGPFPVKRKYTAVKTNPATGESAMVQEIKTRPASKRIDPWNFFPDPACGETIHDGAYTFERDFITEKKLAALKGGEGPAAYFDDQIDACIDEGPDKKNHSDTRLFVPNNEHSKRNVFEIWYCYVDMPAKEVEAAGIKLEDERDSLPVIATMVNDRVIKLALNPIEDGEFPYDVMPWRRKAGMPWGDGVGRQGRVGQRIVTAATRNLMDNAGASAKPHKVMTGDLEQDGDPWTWRANSDLPDVGRAMMFFVQPSLQAELTAIIQMGEQMMEKQTGMPLILLGMQGGVQETAAGRQIQNNNGTSVLRRIARLFDSCITEPHIRRYDKWIKIYSDDPELKGDVTIKARGSSALVERDIQNQQMPVLMNLSLNPAFEWDPVKTGEEYLKSQRFNPKTFQMSTERKQELASRQPPPPPQIAVAQIREQGATQRQQLELQHEAQQADLDRGLKKMELDVQTQIDAAALGSEERRMLETIKAELAGITMKLNTQRELSNIKGAQAMTPPTEPAGRAPAGRAFQQ